MLVVAHPGHELRVFGWVSRARPLTQVLTDGGGAGGRSRVDRSRALISRADCSAGGVFGHASDARFYAAMLDGDALFFTDLLEALASDAIANGIETVVGDAAEGYNPTHDLCRVLIDALVCLVRRRTGRTLASYAFPLTEWEYDLPAFMGEPVRLVLGEGLHREKMQASYAYQALDREVSEAVAALGEDHFRTECFWPALGVTALPAKPHYEAVGEARVRAAAYGQVVRYADHVAPLSRAILAYAAQA